MAGILEAMGAVGGAIALIDRLAENPKGRERTLDSLRLELIYANADAVSNDWMKRYEGRKRAEKALEKIKRKIASLRRAGQWDERFTDYYLGKKSSDEVSENPEMRATAKPYIAYRSQQNGRIMYVTELPGDGGVDYGYGNDARKAKRLSEREAKAFVKYVRHVGGDPTILKVEDNPRSRSKRGITRPSQITGKAPTKRLLKRRKSTTKAPKGFFANPVSARASWCHFGIKVNAGNDRNGNPRRAIAFFRHDGEKATLLAVVNEGYSGTTGAIQDAALDPNTTPVIGTFDVSVSQYRDLLKQKPGIAY